jgi:hypothetical protein
MLLRKDAVEHNSSRPQSVGRGLLRHCVPASTVSCLGDDIAQPTTSNSVKVRPPRRRSASAAIRKLHNLRDIPEDVSGDDEDYASSNESSSSEDEQEASSCDTSSSEDDSSDDDCDVTGKDGTMWTPQFASNRSGPQREENVFRCAPGPTPFAKRNIRSDSPASAFHLIICYTILKIVKECTEAEANRRGVVDFRIEYEELEAFIAIMFYRGMCGAKNFPLKTLWNRTWGSQFVREVMSRDRFCEILSFLRFDMKNTRSQRLRNDKFALISDVWYRFIANSQQAYVPEENLTVDEQLFPTKTRCPFTQYIPSKPDKFGIKFWLLVEVTSKYLCNGFPYLGRDDSRPPNQSLSEFVVLRLMEPFSNKGYNVTCDNFFTSLSLAKALREKRTSVIGTARKNRQELPPVAKSISASEPVHSTKSFSSDGVTLTVYKAKPTKNVILISSRHEFVKIEEGVKQKPNTVAFYNQTKCGVDILDAMARKYTVKPASRRWPVHVFCNILDMAAINAWILFCQVTHVKISRRQFLQRLVEELAEPLKKKRTPAIIRSPNEASTATSSRRVACRAGLCNNNKAIAECSNCAIPICGQCSMKDIKRTCHKCAM